MKINCSRSRVFIICALGACFFASCARAAGAPAIGITCSYSNSVPTRVERDLIDDFEKLFTRALGSLTRSVKQQYGILVLQNPPAERFAQLNGTLSCEEVHGEYEKGSSYTAEVSLSLSALLPDTGVVVKKDFTATAIRRVGTQWAEWVGANTVAKEALHTLVDDMLADEEVMAFFIAVDPLKRLTQQDAPVAAGQPDGRPAAGTASVTDRLKELKALFESGLITEQEYRQQKTRILQEL